METRLMKRIGIQHDKIEKKIDDWTNNISHAEDKFLIQSWLYSFFKYFAYHVTTEEFLLKVDSKDRQSHLVEHRKILNEIMKLNFDKRINIVDLKSKIGGIFDSYFKSHFTIFGYKTNEQLDLDIHKRLRYSNEYGGLLIIFLRKGILNIPYGQIRGELVELFSKESLSIIESIEDYSSKWSKFVDLTHWEYATFDVGKYVREISKLEQKLGRQSVIYFVGDNSLTNFIVEEASKDIEDIFVIREFTSIIGNNELIDMFNSGIIDLATVGNVGIIDEYYDEIF